MLQVKTLLAVLFLSVPVWGQQITGGGGGNGNGTIATTPNALIGDNAGNAIAATGTGTNCVLVNGSSTACSAGSISGLTTNALVTAASSTTLQTICATCTLDSSGNISLAGSGAFGSSPPTITGTGVVAFGESTGQTCAATGVSCLKSDGTSHTLQLSNNNGSFASLLFSGGALGTPSSGTLTSATGLPISTGVSGLGTGVATFLATPSSANLLSAMTTSTGTGSLVFATSPTFVTPLLGTPTSGVMTNVTGLPPAAVTSAQGNGTKFQFSTGSTTTNDCVKFDANGNTVDAGSACGTSTGGGAGATLFSTTASTAVTATSATTLIGAVTGSLTVAANTFTAGALLQFQASGFYSTPATPASLTIDLKIGGTTRITTGAVVQIASVTNGTWELKCNVTTRTAGVSGTQIANCIFTGTGATITPGEAPMQTASTWTVDTTGTLALDLQATWSTTTGAPTITATNVAAWIPGSPVTSVFGATGAIANISGDCTTSGSSAITCTKTSGSSFATSATTDTTNAANISSGTLPAARYTNSYMTNGNFNSGTVASGGTGWVGMGQSAFRTANENTAQTPMPTAGTLSNLTVITTGAQGAVTMTITVRKNGAACTSPSTVSITISASAAAGTFTDLTHSCTWAAGDLVNLQFIEGAATSATFGGWGATITQ